MQGPRPSRCGYGYGYDELLAGRGLRELDATALASMRTVTPLWSHLNC